MLRFIDLTPKIGWEIKKANNTWIFPKSLSLNHRELCGRAHMSACGWVWVCFRVKFSFAALWLLSPRQKNSIIPRSQTQVKSAVLLKETRYILKPQTEKWKRRDYLGGYKSLKFLPATSGRLSPSDCFSRNAKDTSPCSVIYQQASLLGVCIRLCGPSTGKCREEVKQASFRFPLLLILPSSWQESASLAQMHYPICTIRETKGAMQLQVPVAVTGLSNVKRTFPQLSASLWPREGHSKVWPTSKEVSLGAVGRWWEKKFWGKKCVFKIIFKNVKKTKLQSHSLSVTGYPRLPLSYSAILLSWYKLHSSKLVWVNANHICTHVQPHSKS